MKIETTKVNGLPTVHRVIIEEIIITEVEDIQKCKDYEADNMHTNVRLIACRYSLEPLFMECVTELIRLEASNNEDHRQTLLRFITEHFRIIYKQEA